MSIIRDKDCYLFCHFFTARMWEHSDIYVTHFILRQNIIQKFANYITIFKQYIASVSCISIKPSFVYILQSVVAMDNKGVDALQQNHNETVLLYVTVVLIHEFYTDTHEHTHRRNPWEKDRYLSAVTLWFNLSQHCCGWCSPILLSLVWFAESYWASFPTKNNLSL